MPKKILLLDPATILGGAELFCLELLEKLDRVKFKPVLVSSGQQRDYIAKIPTDIVKHLLPLTSLKLITPYKFIINLRKLKQICLKERPDLIFTNTIRAHIYGSLISRKLKIPLVWYVHDFTFPRFFARHFSNMPKAILCNSQAVREDLVQKISAKNRFKLKAIPNSVDLEKLKHYKYCKPNFKWEQNCFYLGAIGRVARWKGYHLLIQAFAKLTTSFTNLRLIIAGAPSTLKDDKKYWQELQMQISAGKLQNRVFLVGFQKNNWDWIKSFDLLCHTATSPEPFGRVIIEAMALDTPVIASNLGGPAEIIQNEKNGFLFNPSQPIELTNLLKKLISNLNLRKKIALEAKETVQQKFNLTLIVKQIEKTF